MKSHCSVDDFYEKRKHVSVEVVHSIRERLCVLGLFFHIFKRIFSFKMWNLLSFNGAYGISNAFLVKYYLKSESLQAFSPFTSIKKLNPVRSLQCEDNVLMTRLWRKSENIGCIEVFSRGHV